MLISHMHDHLVTICQLENWKANLAEHASIQKQTFDHEKYLQLAKQGIIDRDKCKHTLVEENLILFILCKCLGLQLEEGELSEIKIVLTVNMNHPVKA